jgi:hypothetical protein
VQGVSKTKANERKTGNIMPIGRERERERTVAIGKVRV